MDGQRGRSRFGLAGLVLVAGLPSCAPEIPVDALPKAEVALAAAGRRLSQSLSAGALTELATRGDRVLAALTPAERDALSRGYLRFKSDRPVEIFVTAPRRSLPFWLDGQGFRDSALTLNGPGGPWAVFRKSSGPGWVGLGVNGLDRSPRAHYAVFVRAADGLPVRLSGLDGDGWQVATAGEGVDLESDRAAGVRNLPELLRGATLIRTSHDRRHATMLARGRVWKTHAVAGRTPDQVTISFGARPSAGLVWAWRTRENVGRSVVHVRKAGGAATREVRGDSESVTLPDLLNDPVMRRHTAKADGLEPATAYEYTVGDGSAEGTTPWATVRTAPAGSADVSLLYMGDPQCGLEGWGKLLAEAHRRRPDASALLIAGDLVDRGNERTNWDHFFLRAAGVFEEVPVMPCVGNHEYLDRGPWLYRAFFSLPGNGPAGVDADLVYSFEAGDAFVAVLDSTLAVTDPAQAERQAEWLDARLTETRRTWKLVMFHHPVYASHPTRENPSLLHAWAPVFDRHHVDLVLQGHDHAYLRTYPMRADRRVGSPAEGTVYVVSVSGDKFCDVDPRGYGEVGFARVSTYQTIDISARDRRLVYKSFDVSGREVDGFTVEKPTQARSVARR